MDNLPIFDSNQIGNNSVFDPSQSMFIEASAGTGKTYTIQQIVARLICDGTKLDQILIVTYTEKAAGELKDRIRKKIKEVLDNKHLVKDVGDELGNEKLALFETALRELDGAQIFTIHSFCQKTLKTYAYDAWRPFDMQLVDDALVKNILQRKIRDEWPNDPEFQTLLRCYENAEDNADNTESKGLKTVIEDIENILSNAISKYYLDHEGNERIINISKSDEELKEYAKVRDCNDLLKINEFNIIFNTLKTHINYYLSKPTSKPGKRTVQAMIELITNWKSPETLISGYPSAYKQDWNWPDELADAYTKLLEIKERLANSRNTYKIYRNCFLYHQLPKLYLEWRKEKLDHKLESYQDMITVVHQAIVLDRDNTLKEELRKTYAYAIIDEFQDTNRLQWDIFKTLFFEDTDQNRVPDHAIFVVGDPKQSIYAFQGADLTVYEEATQTIGNGKRLSTNYRSTNEIIEACNCLFDSEKGSEFFGDFSGSASPQPPKAQTEFDHIPSKPVWLSKDRIREDEFAKLAAQKIVECCTKTPDGNTRLRVFDKQNATQLRDVSFKDFAILARTRTEFPPIESELKKLGIPFTRYKDDNLFNSRECMQWIALFKAIDAEDFTAYNRRLLSEALLTDFFPAIETGRRIDCGLHNTSVITQRRKLLSVIEKAYDDPQCKERLQIAKYHALARKFRWAEMLECIYRESHIETQTARDLSKLQSLAKFQQIGNYSIEYLYAHRCTLKELVKHLNNLMKNAEQTSDKDGNLVARNTDFDAVQLMTIHASKGLEFPIVIGVAGFKGYNIQAKGPYTYHEHNDKYLGFNDIAKNNQKGEDILEWHRLFYVAYTRASALMVLPRYPLTKYKDNEFLVNSLSAFAKQDNFWAEITLSAQPRSELKAEVLNILNTNSQSANQCDMALQVQQKAAIQALQNSLGKKSLIQHSYSTLADKVQLKKVDPDPEAIDSNGKSTDRASDGEEPGEEALYRLEPNVDLHPKHICHECDYQPGCDAISDADYPKGKQLGNAIHEVFEMMDFTKAQSSLSEFQDDPEVNDLIERTYAKYGLTLSNHPSWRTVTSEFVWKTLNAKLPAIEGGNDAHCPFSLKDLKEDEHFAEVEFFLEGALIRDNNILETGEYFSKGFMDLIFVRELNGTKRYAILDWKSDRMECDEYAQPKALKTKVDREYAVQRVLYAYCLIKWLKQFYRELSESEIFERHFGGIYYAFVRGTASNTSNGIYAQTWDSYQTLENSYKSLTALMFKSAPQENSND